MSPRRQGPRSLERFVIACIMVLGLAGLFITVIQRLDREAEPLQVEIAFPESVLLQATQTYPQAPQALQAAGVTTLIRKPYTLDDMLRYGLAEAWHPSPNRMEIRLADSTLTGNATVFLTGQFGMDALQIRLRENEFICDIALPEPLDAIHPDRFVLEIPAGPMPEGFRRGLLLPAGDWGRTHDLNQFTQAVYSLQPDVVIPHWRGGVNALYYFHSYFNTPWLRKPVAVLPEFSLPWTAKTVIRKQTQHYLARGHVIRRREAAKHTPERLRLRLLRAVRERQVPFLYLEPPKHWTFEQTLVFFRRLHQDMVDAGYTAGAMRQPDARGVSKSEPKSAHPVVQHCRPFGVRYSARHLPGRRIYPKCGRQRTRHLGNDQFRRSTGGFGGLHLYYHRRFRT